MVLLTVKAAAGLGLLVALGGAAWARAPRRAPSARELGALLGGVGLLYATAVVAALAGAGVAAEGACALGVMLSALAGWLSRGDGDGGDGPPGTEPIDWGGFDRARRGWERPRSPARR